MEIKWHDKNKPHMQVRKSGEVTYLTYPSFEQFPDIVHCFSTRLGGVSEGIFASMNLSFTRGDEEAAVKENYRRLGEAVGFWWRILSHLTRHILPMYGWWGQKTGGME